MSVHPADYRTNDLGTTDLLSGCLVVLLSNDGIGVGPAGEAVQPAVEVVAEGARAEHAEAVLLPEAIDLDYNVTHCCKERGERRGQIKQERADGSKTRVIFMQRTSLCLRVWKRARVAG